MNPDKKIIIDGLLERVNASPFVIVIDYTGLSVKQFTELRDRLRQAGSACTVAKNTYMRKALAEAGLPDLGDDLTGQTAFITGDNEVFAAAKAIKNFEKEFKKPQMKIGLLGNAVLDADKLKTLADIPSREAVLAQLLGTILEPASMIARVLKAKFDPDGEQIKPAEPEPAAAE
jgi:large subunit ribosomal protein L10